MKVDHKTLLSCLDHRTPNNDDLILRDGIMEVNQVTNNKNGSEWQRGIMKLVILQQYGSLHW